MRVIRTLNEHGVRARRPWWGGRRGYGDQLSPRETGRCPPAHRRADQPAGGRGTGPVPEDRCQSRRFAHAQARRVVPDRSRSGRRSWPRLRLRRAKSKLGTPYPKLGSLPDSSRAPLTARLAGTGQPRICGKPLPGQRPRPRDDVTCRKATGEFRESSAGRYREDAAQPVTSHDRHPPGIRRTGQDQRAEPEIPAGQGTARDPGTAAGEADRAEGAQDEGDQGDWGRPGQPDQAGQAGQRDDFDEYEPL